MFTDGLAEPVTCMDTEIINRMEVCEVLRTPGILWILCILQRMLASMYGLRIQRDLGLSAVRCTRIDLPLPTPEYGDASSTVCTVVVVTDCLFQIAPVFRVLIGSNAGERC